MGISQTSMPCFIHIVNGKKKKMKYCKNSNQYDKKKQKFIYFLQIYFIKILYLLCPTKNVPKIENRNKFKNILIT